MSYGEAGGTIWGYGPSGSLSYFDQTAIGLLSIMISKRGGRR